MHATESVTVFDRDGAPMAFPAGVRATAVQLSVAGILGTMAAPMPAEAPVTATWGPCVAKAG